MIYLKKFNESKRLTEDDVTYSVLEILDEGFTFNGDLSKMIAHFNFTSTVRFSSTPVNMLSFVRRCDTNKNERTDRFNVPSDKGRWILQATGIERMETIVDFNMVMFGERKTMKFLKNKSIFVT